MTYTTRITPLSSRDLAMEQLSTKTKRPLHLTVHERFKNILRQLNVMKYTPIHQCNCFIDKTSRRPVSNVGFTRDPFKPTSNVVLFTVSMKALRRNKQLRRRRNCSDQRQPRSNPCQSRKWHACLENAERHANAPPQLQTSQLDK